MMVYFFGNCLMEMWLYYHKPQAEAWLQTFKNSTIRLFENLNGQHMMVSMIHMYQVNALNTVYLFMLEEKCQGVEVFHAKDLEKYTWKFSQKMEFNMNLIHHGLPPHWFQIMMILKSVI